MSHQRDRVSDRYHRAVTNDAFRCTDTEAQFRLKLIPDHQKNGYSHWIGLQLRKNVLQFLRFQLSLSLEPWLWV